MSIISEVLLFLLHPVNLLLILGGSTLGVVFGAIPGLSGGLCIMLMLPLTFSMDVTTAITFLMSIYIGGISGGCIGSILLGIPGCESSLATTYDGYAMTKKGECVRALSAAVVANFLGTIPSVLVASIAARSLARMAMKVGPWEFFALGVCAVILVITLSKDNLYKGLIAAALGILCTCIGIAPIDGAMRFTYGNTYLMSGLNLTYVFMGIFATRNIMVEFARKDPSKDAKPEAVTRFKWPTEDLRNNKWNIIRSWFTGLWIGFLPGMGAGLSNITAYAQAKNASKEPEKFGTGIIDGVFAPEVANNASTGGALIPFLALGIPGDTSTSYLLGGLTLHGVITGPRLFTDYSFLANLILIACIIAGLMVLCTEIVGMPLFPKILGVPYQYLYSAIILLCIIGVYSSEKLMFHVFMFLIFSVVGVVMDFGKLPTAPFALAFVLGKLLETNLRRGLSYSDTGFMSFLTRPVSCVLLLVAVWSLISPYVKLHISKVKPTYK